MFNVCSLEEWRYIFPYITNQRPLLVLLRGPMGVGKTTFVREFLHYIGYKGRVKSPTFTYEITYDGVKVSHLDLYRIKGRDTDIVYEIVDRLDDGFIVFVEWPERLMEEISLIQKDYSVREISIEFAEHECRTVYVE